MSDVTLTNTRRLRALMTGYWRIVALLLCVGFWAPPAAAVDFESPATIRQAVAGYALAAAKHTLPGARLSVRAASLDARLRLPVCGQPLQISASSANRRVGNTVVSVRCPGPHPWKLYVPVKVSARLSVLVAAQPLVRGAQITAAMLSRAERDVARLPYGYFTRSSAVIGQVLKRNLEVGAPLTPGVLRAPWLVRRGQVVTLTAGAEGFSVTTQGVALQDGARGSLVRVRNSRSKRVVQGVVTGSGKVRVDG